MFRKKVVLLLYSLLYGLLFIPSYLLGNFAFDLQENFYTGPNRYYAIEKFLHFQTSATSFAYTVYACFAVMSALCFFWFLVFLWTKRVYWMFPKAMGIGSILGIGIWGIGHEIEQLIMKPYPDNNWLDMFLSSLVCALFIVYLWKYFPNHD